MSREPAVAKSLTTRQAAFIGVGSMVGAGIFALLGAAGAVAGAAVAFAVVTLANMHPSLLAPSGPGPGQVHAGTGS
jgi:amino acid transporter